MGSSVSDSNVDLFQQLKKLKIESNTHTFHYVKAPRLDQRIKELDVKTYMTEGALKKAVARTGYYSVRGMAMVGQCIAVVALFIFTQMTRVGKEVVSLGGKAIYFVIHLPTNIAQTLFPTEAQKTDKKVARLNNLFKKNPDTTANDIVKDLQSLPHDEKKKVAKKWLEKTLQEYPDDPDLKNFIEQIVKFADGDIAGEELISIKQTITQKLTKRQLFRKDAVRFPPNLNTVMTAFLKLFEKEREYEKTLSIATIKSDYSLLLKHPNLLKRADVAPLMEKAPYFLKKKICDKKVAVLTRVLSCAHKQEEEFLKAFPEWVKPLEPKELEKKYKSSMEKEYLDERLDTIQKRLDDLSKAPSDTLSFEKQILLLEQQHLQAQRDEMLDAEKVLNATTQAAIDEANIATDNFKKLALKALKERIKACDSKKADKLFAQDAVTGKIASFDEIAQTIREMQKDEMTELKKEKAVLPDLAAQLTEYSKLEQNIKKVHELPVWAELGKIKSVKERREKRMEGYAKDVICFSLDGRAECQLPLLLAKKDVRSLQAAPPPPPPSSTSSTTPPDKSVPAPKKDVLTQITKEAEKFVEQIQKSHLELFKKKLLTYAEAKCDLQGENMLNILNTVVPPPPPGTPPEPKKEEINFEELSAGLNIGNALNAWHRELQQIWLKHIPYEQEQEILTASRSERTKKMADCFDQWVQRVTGHKIPVALSFEGLLPPEDSTAAREAAIMKLRNNKRFIEGDGGDKPGVREKFKTLRENMKAAKGKQQLQQKGFTADLMETSFVSTTAKAIECQAKYIPIKANAKSSVDVISAFEKQCPTFPGANTVDEIEAIAKYIRVLNSNERIRSSAVGKAMIRSQCSLLLKHSEEMEHLGYPTNPIDQDIVQIFVNTYKKQDGSFDLEQLSSTNNEFLSILIRMLFSCDSTAVTLTEKQREHLAQLHNLSGIGIEFYKDRLQIADCGDFAGEIIEQVGTAIQQTYLRLEGLEENVLQASFQDSRLTSPEDRKRLDCYRAQSSHNLSFELIDYVYNNIDLKHDQGREILARALKNAMKYDFVKTDVHIRAKIVEHASDSFDSTTLAPPLWVFYMELLGFENLTVDQEDRLIDSFVHPLFGSSDVSQKLLGCSYLILLMDSKRKNEGDDSVQCQRDLLLAKILYQHLKANYFGDRREITGFLKTQVDKVEALIQESRKDIWKKLDQSSLAMIDGLRGLWEGPYDDSSFAETAIQQEILGTLKKAPPEPTVSPIPGFLAFGNQLHIDVVTGIVFHNGRQRAGLPAHLQNHPDILALGIGHFPYAYDSVNKTYVYNTTEKVKGSGGQEEIKDIPQIIIKEVNGSLIIHKNIRISEDDRRMLQFVPKEQLTLPRAVSDRMGVKHFWLYEEDRIFGFDDKGDLQVTVARDMDAVITKTGDEYRILKEKNRNDAMTAHLLKSFDINEILMSEDGNAYYIPAIGLTVKKETIDDSSVWVGECPGMTKKILETTTQNSTCLIFKNKQDSKKVKRIKQNIKEAKYRLQLEKQGGMQANHLIRSLKKIITQCEEELAALEQCTYISVVPERTTATANKLAAEEQMEKMRAKHKAVHKAVLDQRPGQAVNFKADLEVLQKMQADYDKEFNKPLAAVFFEKTHEQTLASKDLKGALAIALRIFDVTIDEAAPIRVIKELAKYPSEAPLKDPEYALLEKAIEEAERLTIITSEDRQLIAYLHLMRYMHHTYRRQALAQTLSEKPEEVAKIERAVQSSLDTCKSKLCLLGNPPTAGEPFEPPVAELLQAWRKTGILPAHSFLNATRIARAPVGLQKEKPLTGMELQYYQSQTPLERFYEAGAVEAVHKDPDQEIKPEQKALLSAFSQHSKKQVLGFYLEGLGLFNKNSLCDEFRIDSKTKTGLFGLTGKNIDNLFAFLEKEGYIAKPNPKEAYYRLTSPEKVMSQFQVDKIRAHLTYLGLDEKQMTRIMDRLQGFLFRALRSGFTFSMKREAELAGDLKLQEAKQEHLQKYLEAEAVLQKYVNSEAISKSDKTLSIADIRYAWLSGNWSRFEKEQDRMRLSRAMTMYLFHRTEYQHAENIQKAPAVGERNKIELLQTKRNYSIELLLKEGCTGDDREEQIKQRAFLAFEEDYGFRCNNMQIKMFRGLMLDSDDEEAIDAAQARMGFGKTALLPLLAIIQVAREYPLQNKDKHLIRYVVPRAVIEDNTTAFNKRLGLLKGRAIKDREFSRYQIDYKNKKKSFELIIQDLKDRLRFYEQIRNEGTVLIQWPEVRGSLEAQELDFAQMIIKGSEPFSEEELSEEEMTLCIKAKHLINQVRNIKTYTVFDELDNTQDETSREVNFTRGGTKAITPSSVRPLQKLVDYIENNKEETNLETQAIDFFKIFFPNPPSANVVRYLTNTDEPLNDDVKALLSPNLLGDLDSDDAEYSENDSAIFLMRALLTDKYIMDVAKTKQPNTHFGVRYSEVGGVRHYDHDYISQAPFLVNVPYEGTNTPKGRSIYDNTEVAALTTLRYFRSKETVLSIEPHLDFLVIQAKRNAIPRDLFTEPNFEEVFQQLDQMAKMFDLEEQKEAKQKFYEQWMEEPSKEFRDFLGMTVVATQVRADAECAKSDRYEQGCPGDIVKGCSGTVGGTSSYFKKQQDDPAADGIISLEIMGREENAEIKVLTPPSGGDLYLPSTITTLLNQATRNTRAIVDVAGMCKSPDANPETIIAELWNQIQSRHKKDQFDKIEGIIYYGKDAVKRLYKGPGVKPDICTTEIELAGLAEKKYFTFYSQNNARGSDVKQADGAHALVTIDENVLNSDAKQAVLRFRSLISRYSNQSFSFVVMPEFEQILKARLNQDAKETLTEIEDKLKDYRAELRNKPNFTMMRDDNEGTNTVNENDLKDYIAILENQKATIENRLKALDTMTLKSAGPGKAQNTLKAKEIVNFLRLQEKSAEEKNALTIFNKEMKAHVKQAAAHFESEILAQINPSVVSEQYVEFLKERDVICEIVTKSRNALYLKYGHHITGKNRDDYVADKELDVKAKIAELFVVAKDFRENCCLSEPAKIKESSYDERIEQSTKIFKKRYRATTPVEELAIDAGAQAVAQAMAEAQAESLAQNLAERLAEAEVISAPRLVPPAVNMVTGQKLEINIPALLVTAIDISRNSYTYDVDTHTGLTPIKNVPRMKHFVHPDQHDEFLVSDTVVHSSLVSHFVLSNEYIAVFVSQEEADEFQGMLEDDRQGFQLFDIRKTDIPNPELARSGIYAALQPNGVPTIAELREFDNVKLRQLNPQLVAEKALRRYMETNPHYGLSEDMSFNVAIDVSRGQTTITIDDGDSFVIPKDNDWLDEKFIALGDPGKLHSLIRWVNEAIAGLDLDGLARAKAELEVKNNQAQAKIAAFKAFTINEDGVKAVKMTHGQQFIDECNKITTLQTALATVSPDKRLAKLQELQDCFNRLIAPSTIAAKKAGTYKTIPLTTKETEKRLIEHCYEEILKWHKGNLAGAIGCSQAFCRSMFESVIPDAAQAVAEIGELIAEIKANEPRIKILQAQIAEREAKKLELENAQSTIMELVQADQRITASLAQKGYITSSCFDMFKIQDIARWGEVRGTIKGTQPEYKHVVANMETYQANIKALTEKEAEELRKSKNYKKYVLECAAQPKERSISFA